MSIKKLSDLPNLNNVRIDGFGNPLPISDRIKDEDLISISITGNPGDPFNGGSYSPSGWASVKVEFSDVIDKIENSLQISTIESNIASLSAEESSLAAGITSITGTTIPQIQSNITAISGVNSSQQSSISSLSSQILENDSDITGISSSISSLSSQILEHDSDITGISSNISSLSATNGTQTSNISSLSSQVLAISSDISGHVEGTEIFIEYNSYGYSAAVSAAVEWNASLNGEWESSGIAFQTGEFLKIHFGNPPSARYIPLYIYSKDHPV